MADLIIKPSSSSDSLKFQGSDGSDKFTITGTSATIASGVAVGGAISKVHYYEIGEGTLSPGGTTAFPVDDTKPQRDEGSEVWSGAITPQASTTHLLIQAHVKLCETSSLTNESALALFISDSDDALVVFQGMNERSAGGGPFNDLKCFINYRYASWGATEKTFSLRASGAQAFNYFESYGNYSRADRYGGTITSAVLIYELA